MDEFEARFESLRAQFKDYGSLYDENFEGRFTREDCREVLAMVDNLPADDVASKPGFKARCDARCLQKNVNLNSKSAYLRMK
ncbi:myosin, light chain 2, 20 kDa [Corchorus olitorius]|uniref:Myosin, light chain 2, 20 kDa n=1 Tax=Corchorus olitorius TaxID=93759 RepID=A0A1R3JP90_9ROSI|nr:myosin, light chain 2, 20 kDa [Corchorus olitorius]